MLSLALLALAAGPMTSSLRADGALLVNSRPVLPYGFYISTEHTAADRLRCVEAAHAAGATVVHIQGPWPDDARFLDRAAELGVWVVAGHVETPAKLDRVKRFRDHPAVVAWTLHDDANTLSNVPQLAEMNKLVKAEVPHRLTFIPLGTQNRDVVMPADAFYGCADVIGWEMYPVANPKAADPSLKATEAQCRQVAASCRKAGRPFWLLPQTFAWPGGRVPTPAEYRNLCYVGLTNGAKGLMSWSMFAEVDNASVRAKKQAAGEPFWAKWYLPDSPDLWAECGRVGAELKQLAPLLLDGTFTKMDAGDGLSAACWRGERETLVVVANLSESEPRPVRVAVPGGKLTPAFAGRPAGLTVADGMLTGTASPAAVHVYRLER